MSSWLSKTLSLIVYLANTTVLDHTALGDVTPCMCAFFISALTLPLTSEKYRNTNVSTTPSANRSILQLRQHASLTNKQPTSNNWLQTEKQRGTSTPPKTEAGQEVKSFRHLFHLIASLRNSSSTLPIHNNYTRRCNQSLTVEQRDTSTAKFQSLIP